MNEEIQREHIPNVPCPRCRQEKMFLTKTKRTFAWKCENCGFDTNWLTDVMRHRVRELEVLPMLKQMFPQLVFVENIPVDSEPITGEVGHSTVRYDFGIYWFGKKISKCKVSVVQNITQDRYLLTEEQYIQGRPNVFEYLARIDAVMIFYFPDEPDERKKIAMASCRELKRFAVMTKDRFNNDQYTLPVAKRNVVIKTDFADFKQLIFRNFYDAVTENIYIV